MNKDVEKIRAEVERRYNYHKDHADDWAGTCNFWSAHEDREILSFIDSMQKEPEFKVGDTLRRKSDGCHAKVIEVRNGNVRVESTDWDMWILNKEWELVEEPETSVWHDNKDTPVASKTKIVLYTNGKWDLFKAYKADNDFDNYWANVNQSLEEKGVLVKHWAYVDDLLTLSNLETTKESKKCMYSKDDFTDEDRKVLCDGCEEECKYSESDDFTKALAECILQSQCNVVDPMVLAETWKDELIKLAKSEEPVSEIWHNCDEKPKIGEVIIMYDTKYTYPECGYLVDERKFIFNNGSMDWEACNLEYERWAYFSDLRHKKEEPVSEDLEKASKEWIRPQLDKSYADYGETKMMELTHFDGYAMLDAIEFGAQWQKAKDESVTKGLGEYINELSKQFPEVSFAKLSRIAVRVAKWQKQQIKKSMYLGEPPYLISVEQAYYRTVKLLED